MSGTSTSDEQPEASPAPAERAPALRPRWRRVLRAVAVTVASVWVVVTLAAFGYDLTTGGALPRPPLDANGHDVRTDGLVTHYEQWGTTGPPIVLVHGFLESAWVWHLTGPQLAAQGYRVYAIDVRGFGYTERRGPYTLAGDTEQLGAFLTALHLTAAEGPTPVLVGHSSGAAIVTDLARLQPASVRRIVLMDGDGTPYGVGPGWIHSL